MGKTSPLKKKCECFISRVQVAYIEKTLYADLTPALACVYNAHEFGHHLAAALINDATATIKEKQ